MYVWQLCIMCDVTLTYIDTNSTNSNSKVFSGWVKKRGHLDFFK